MLMISQSRLIFRRSLLLLYLTARMPIEDILVVMNIYEPSRIQLFIVETSLCSVSIYIYVTAYMVGISPKLRPQAANSASSFWCVCWWRNIGNPIGREGTSCFSLFSILYR
jgi:hypothetical protein